jgi:hypothetical protein
MIIGNGGFAPAGPNPSIRPDICRLRDALVLLDLGDLQLSSMN